MAMLALAFAPRLASPCATRHAHRPAVRACAATPPSDVDSTARLASASLAAALAAGHRRAHVQALIPGLNPLVEDTFAFSSATLNWLALRLALDTEQLRHAPQCALLFASAGGAAAAATQYRRAHVQLPTGVYVATFDEPNEHANVLVAPKALRGDPLLPVLEHATSRAPHALWVMLNGDLSGERAAIGMRESARRAAFARSFELAFYFRNLFLVRRPSLRAEEKGALLFRHGQGWRAFALREQTAEYALVGEWTERPDGALVAALVESYVDNARMPNERAGDLADARFLRVVAVGGVLAAALTAALQLRSPP